MKAYSSRSIDEVVEARLEECNPERASACGYLIDRMLNSHGNTRADFGTFIDIPFGGKEVMPSPPSSVSDFSIPPVVYGPKKEEAIEKYNVFLERQLPGYDEYSKTAVASLFYLYNVFDPSIVEYRSSVFFTYFERVIENNIRCQKYCSEQPRYVPVVYHMMFALDVIDEPRFCSFIEGMFYTEFWYRTYIDIDRSVLPRVAMRCLLDLTTDRTRLVNNMVERGIRDFKNFTEEVDTKRVEKEFIDFFFNVDGFCNAIEPSFDHKKFVQKVTSLKLGHMNAMTFKRLSDIYISLLKKHDVTDYSDMLVCGHTERKSFSLEEEDASKDDLSLYSSSAAGDQSNPTELYVFPVDSPGFVHTFREMKKEKRSNRGMTIVNSLNYLSLDYLSFGGDTTMIISYIIDKIHFIQRERENTVHADFRNVSLDDFIDTLSPEGYKNIVGLANRNEALKAKYDSYFMATLLCKAKYGFEALVELINNVDDEMEKKKLFVLIVKQTLTDRHSGDEVETLPRFDGMALCRRFILTASSNFLRVVSAFPEYCYIEELDFGIVRECVERFDEMSELISHIIEIPNISATINKRYRYYGNSTPLCMCHLASDPINLMKKLLKAGADPMATTGSGENFLHFFARSLYGMLDLQTVNKLKCGIEVRRNIDNATPLMVAIAHENNTIADYLVSSFGARVDTAFGYAKSIRTIEAAALLCHSRFVQRLVDRTGFTPSNSLIAKAALNSTLDFEEGKDVANYDTGLSFNIINYKKQRAENDEGRSNMFACKALCSTSGPKESGWKRDGEILNKDLVYALQHIHENRDGVVDILRRVKDKVFTYDECPICLDAMDNGEDRAMIACGHIFHEICVNRLREKSCPVCRKIFVRALKHSDNISF